MSVATLVATTPRCGACGNENPADVVVHCQSPTCHWGICPKCGASYDHSGRFTPKEDRDLIQERTFRPAKKAAPR